MRDTTQASTVHAARMARELPRLTIPALAGGPQHGAIGIMLAVLLPVILGIIGLSLEVAQLYNRKVEMQAIADAAAVSAAGQLDGTAEGITRGVAAAHDIVENGFDWTRLKYMYRNSLAFSDGAIRFGRSADGSTGWLDAGAAKATPAGLAYVQVDTNGLNAEYGKVQLLLMPFVGALTPVQVRHTAVAGRRRLKVTPLAICAMSADPANPLQERKNGAGFSELTEYGFRRGVSYNLLRLNPKAGTAAHYLVDPISLPPRSAASNFLTANVGQYVCTGTVELPGVVDGKVNVQDGFPIGTLVNHLNSRFDASKGDCNPISAPPDTNIRSFAIAGNSWMAKPNAQVAETVTTPTSMQTVADLPPPNDLVPTRYGPLWVFGRPVPWAADMAHPEPVQGYTPFPATSAAWKGLYSTGPTMVGTYPAGTPYVDLKVAPTVNPPGVAFRRVLNVPLLDCPVAGSEAKVLALGRFFMTIPADVNGIYAEFAGIAAREEFAGPVEVVQ